MGAALAGCSGASLGMPDWVSIPSFSSGPPVGTLQFESEPPGAEVRSAQGRTCRTPCSLALPLTPQQVTFAMEGFAPLTVPVDVRQPDRSGLDFPTPEFAPNPVEVSMLAAEPPRGPPPKARKSLAKAAKPKRPPPPQDGTDVPPPPAR